MLNTENKLEEINKLLHDYPRTKAKLIPWVKERMLQTQAEMKKAFIGAGGEEGAIGVPDITDEMVEMTLPALFEQFYYLLLYFFDDNEVYISITKNPPSGEGFNFRIAERSNSITGNSLTRFEAEKESILEAFNMLETKNGFV